MSKKRIKAQVEKPNTQTEEENQMETVQATIVESSEAQVFSSDADIEELSTQPNSQAVDNQPTEAGVDSTEIQPTEKPAPKPRVNRRPYISMVSEHLELGDLDRKEIIKLVLEQFPEVRKGGIQTFVTDLLNPKYSYFNSHSAPLLPLKREFSSEVSSGRQKSSVVSEGG
jgi:hypothetical protein